MLLLVSINSALVGGPPYISPRQATSITATEALLSGTAGAAANHTVAYFEYGLDSTYGNIAGFTTLSSTDEKEISIRIGSAAGSLRNIRRTQLVQGDKFMSPAVCSADGTRILMAEAGSANGGGGGYLYTSSDSGLTWSRGDRHGYWSGLACSADGLRLVAVELPGWIRVSVDGGGTWSTPIVPPHAEAARSARNWQSVACSADGMRIAAIARSSQSMPEEGVYLSSDGGSTWSRSNPFPSGNYKQIASSADGLTLAMTGPSLHTFISSNGGFNWTDRAAIDGSMALSGDGRTLIVAKPGGRIYVSKNGGLNWFNPADGVIKNWQGVAVSFDGSKLAASFDETTAAGGDGVLLSSDGGFTWTSHQGFDLGSGFYSIAMSVDGMQVVGGGNNNSFISMNAAAADLAPNTTYHFRMIGLNREGSARGPDMTFTTTGPSAPAATTLPVIVGGATEAGLRGEVRPNGFATTAYFEFGLDAGYGHQSELIEVAAGQGGVVKVGIGSADDTEVGVVWSARTNAPLAYRLSSSADGTRLLSVPSSGQIHTSLDGGATWRASGPALSWAAVASSADGMNLVAAAYRGSIYTSSDGGLTWATANSTPPNTRWQHVACSSDGGSLVLVVYGGGIYTSTDQGSTWTQQVQAPNLNWTSVASSADGMKLAAVADAAEIYTSEDGGLSWKSSGSKRSWRSIACSADGNRLVALDHTTGCVISTDGGVSWVDRGPVDPFNRFFGFTSVASSADGLKLVATSGLDTLRSVNGGETWVTIESAASRGRVVSSSDGERLATATSSGQLFTTSRSEGATAELLPNTIYHYRLVAINGEGLVAGEEMTFRTSGLAPTVATLPIPFTNSSPAGTILLGTVNPNGLAASVYFEYGLDTVYGLSSPVQDVPQGHQEQDVSIGISGLAAATVYHYRLVGVSEDGISLGEDQTFQTPSMRQVPGTDKPAVITGPAVLTDAAVTLQGTVNPSGLATETYFEIGQDTSYGTHAGLTSLAAGLQDSPVQAVIGALASGRTYHYRLVAVNAAGAAHGEDMTFTTPQVTRFISPEITTSLQYRQLSFQSDPGLVFSVSFSTDANLAPEHWTGLGQTFEDPPGTYRFLDMNPLEGVRFYRLIAP